MNIAVKKINKMWLFVSVDFLFQRERGETKKKKQGGEEEEAQMFTCWE